MPEGASGTEGIFGSLRLLAETFLALLQNRVALVALEFRECESRAVVILIGGVILAFTSLMSMLVITVLFVVAFWDQRVLVLLCFSILYVAAAFTAYAVIRKRLKAPVFSQTVAQLKKDRACLFGRK